MEESVLKMDERYLLAAMKDAHANPNMEGNVFDTGQNAKSVAMKDAPRFQGRVNPAIGTWEKKSAAITDVPVLPGRVDHAIDIPIL
mmetsp:Transcript_36923/g.79727  ORF Transcript_36923/g.79727 Transcript_36923/m.79727 type:complete len:86 (+) Transcript_36923:276-533(+)